MTIPPPASNLELVRAAFDAFNAGDLDACVEYAAPDLIIHLAELSNPLHGRDTWRQGAEMIRSAFPDLRAEIEDIFAAGDRVAARLVMRGTHEGDYLGISTTGRPVRYVSHEFYRVEDGLIGEEWICSDTASLFKQLT
jgi:steroid delta-isomerase-like uncharacterized protein